MDRKTSQESYSRLRTTTAALVASFVLVACASNDKEPLALDSPITSIPTDAPANKPPAPAETVYTPAETTTTSVTAEQTTRTTHPPEAAESASPESQSASDYIRSDERSVIVNDHLERLKGQFTELLEQHPDKVWFYNFTTGENSRGLKSSDDAGILELRFGDSKDTEETIYAYVNANFGQDEDFKDRFAGYGVITGPENDPLARRELSHDQSPTGDTLSGPVYASFMDKADIPGTEEDAIRGSTYDFYSNPDATSNDVDIFDREIAAEIFGAMQNYLILNPDETIRGQVVPAAPSTTR